MRLQNRCLIFQTNARAHAMAPAAAAVWLPRRFAAPFARAFRFDAASDAFVLRRCLPRHILLFGLQRAPRRAAARWYA